MSRRGRRTARDLPLRALFIVPTLQGGGAERVVTTLLTHIDRHRIDASLAVVDMTEAVNAAHLPATIRLIDLERRRVSHALPRIVRLIWSMRPDVVLSTIGHLNVAMALIKPLLPRTTRVLGRETAVVSENLANYGSPRLWRWAYRHVYRWLDMVICQSVDMHRDLTATLGFPANKTRLIPNPVDIDRIRLSASEFDPTALKRSNDEVVLVAAGRLVPQKGFDLLISAVSSCRDLPLRVFILGEGALRPVLERQIAELNLTDRVSIVGFVTNPYGWFLHADALVLSSRFEGFPNVALEALACGTPVVSTPAPGGVDELLRPLPSCEIAPEISAAGLAVALRRWVARRPGRISRDVIEQYSATEIARRYEDAMIDSAGWTRSELPSHAST